MLWSVSGQGQAFPSYVFGTMHVKDERAFAFFELACERINNCQAVALELDLGSISPADQAALLGRSPDKSLEALLTPHKFRRIRRFFLRALRIDIHPLRHLSPLLVSNLINERLLDNDHPAALDEELWKYAIEHHKAIIGIETYQEQIQVLSNITPEVQAQSIVAMARRFEQHRKQLLYLAERYAAGDLPQLHQSSKRQLSGMRYLMLYRRNQIMAERIGEIIKVQPTFCAIGAGHLYGGKGVLRLLNQQGLTVRPVAS